VKKTFYEKKGRKKIEKMIDKIGLET